MKKNIFRLATILTLLTAMCTPVMLNAQSSSKKMKIVNEGKNAKAAFIKTDPLMKNLFDKAYGYAIFPNIGKGGAGVGGAAGSGAVYEKGKLVGTAKMVQVSVGLQLGGQVYQEVIFFEDKAALDHFKDSKLEFAGQASAVAVKSGASADVKYRDGVMVFTEEKTGLMLEAALGGQKFTYHSW